jgi:aspartyl protease family protein
MATGFMAGVIGGAAFSLAAATLGIAACAHAAEVSVIGLFNGKAVIAVDGSKPRTIAAGQSTPEGVKLISASSEAAVIEYDGRRQTLTTGQGTRLAASAPESTGGQVVLKAGAGGHFVALGAINGVTVRFVVDTGATSIALSSEEARRLGLNYLQGARIPVTTAAGTTAAYRLTLDTVRVGEITLNNVEAVVLEGRYPNVVLLGMSFLNRTRMMRDGDTLKLVRRY